MNQAYKEAIGIIVRQLLISLGTALGLQTMLAPDSVLLNTLVQQVVAALCITGPVVYAQVVQRFKRQKLMQALSTTVKVSESTIEAMVKDPSTLTPPITLPKTQVPI